MEYYPSVKNLSENITWYCIQLSLWFTKDTDNLQSWPRKRHKNELLVRKKNFALRHYENQFYKKIQKYLKVIFKCICGRDFWYLLVTFSKDKKIPTK